ncbi:helix-turn-helix transcriptional regulator [Amycolatopsis sp. NPDC051128]|uniref:helix-turn-helix domain-containing protein n=1 Tax=Amycolatopsis sp. NPDC051128 TaxID=3155412 RepID=UPI00341B58CF
MAPTRETIKGPVRDQVAANVRARRERLRLSLADVAALLTQLGHPMGRHAVLRIETGARAASVDDLVALALALDCSPLALLLPSEDPGEPVKITSRAALEYADAWHWARGKGTSRPKILTERKG